jgi:beta-1,4-N-acetylglucosaminyltransferase
MGKRAFTTVGSTSFSELIKAVLSTDTIGILESLGITQLSIQYGSDEQLFLDQIKNIPTSMTITGFSYSPSIDKEMKLADLIISHAGTPSPWIWIICRLGISTRGIAFGKTSCGCSQCFANG